MPYPFISVEILGQWVRWISVFSITHESSIILLVIQEDKTKLSAKDPKPQVIAGAVAAFQMNNCSRAWVGLEKRDHMSILAITMLGTWPIFYIIPVIVTKNKHVSFLKHFRSCDLNKNSWSSGLKKNISSFEQFFDSLLYYPLLNYGVIMVCGNIKQWLWTAGSTRDLMLLGSICLSHC